MALIKLIPQRKEFYELYRHASANVVAIAQALVAYLETFPNGGVETIKELEHTGDLLDAILVKSKSLHNVLLVVVVAVALGFDFTNGFHDTANSIATAVGARAMSPRVAVLIAAAANLAGAFLTTAVAKTVGKGIIDAQLATQQTILAAL